MCDADDPFKTWYTKINTNASRDYFLALLQATPGKPVPHLEKERIYKELLGLEVKDPVRRPKVPDQVADCDWPEDMLVPRVPRRRRRRAAPLAPVPIEDQGDDEEESDGEEGSLARWVPLPLKAAIV